MHVMVHTVDYDETFSPVVKPVMVHTIHVSCSLTRMADLPARCQECIHPQYVDWDGLLHTTYWFLRPCSAWLSLSPQQVTIRFEASTSSMVQQICQLFALSGFCWIQVRYFIFRRGSETVYQLLYVDDIVLTASSTEFLQWTISAL
jgi:hypothetical protein